ncbi:MAG TPA: MBOAT family O-acyltransferase [Flavobacteriales bacterium]|nr:MBOAT family O-acyltransferase [Flavobacteriales bacterium]
MLFLAVFLPLFLLIYTFLPARAAWKNTFVLLASIGFYAWGAPRFILVVLSTTFLDFHLVRRMDACEGAGARKRWLVASLLLNTGLLVWFKYAGFFADNLDVLLHEVGAQPIHLLRVVLPIGISFFTFESITYAVDVYRRVHAPLHDFRQYQFYILFFPKLIAGPIVRYIDIADQIGSHVARESAGLRVSGFLRFSIGLAKKVLLANVLGEVADQGFAFDPAQASTAQNWLAAVAYSLQIYFDFSGYSDMAIGLATIMGIRLPENFNDPYIAKSITEFWRRWHITLGAWMKNYLYIPLGGNRRSQLRTCFNLLVVFLLSGLWHGAAWGFVLWGLYHGVFLMLERVLPKVSVPAVLRHVYALLVVVVGWVLFRSADVASGMARIRRLFAFDGTGSVGWPLDGRQCTVLVLAAVFALIALVPAVQRYQLRILDPDAPPAKHFPRALLALALFGLSVFMLSGAGHDPFIYFRF